MKAALCLIFAYGALGSGAEAHRGEVATREALVAFAKAYAQVRYTHPSDEALRAPWANLLDQGLTHFAALNDTRDLQTELQRFFSPFAPSIQFLPKDRLPIAPRVPPGTHYVVRYAPNTGRAPRKREYAIFGERPPQGWPDPQGNQGEPLSPSLQMLCPRVCFASSTRHTLPRAIQALPIAAGPTSPRNPSPNMRLLVQAWGILWLFHPNTKNTHWEGHLEKALAPSQPSFSKAFLDLTVSLADPTLICRKGPPLKGRNVTCWRLSDAYTLQWKP